MPAATPVYALPYPVPADPADVPADMGALANRIEAVVGPGTVNGQIPVWDNATKKWVAQVPAPIADVGYVELTTGVTINVTTGTGVAILSLPALTFDGTTAYWLEFFVPTATTSGHASQAIQFLQMLDGTEVGVIAQIGNGSTATVVQAPVMARRKITPAAGSHTYAIRGRSSVAGTNSVSAGTGGAPAYTQGWLRMYRA